MASQFDMIYWPTPDIMIADESYRLHLSCKARHYINIDLVSRRVLLRAHFL